MVRNRPLTVDELGKVANAETLEQQVSELDIRLGERVSMTEFRPHRSGAKGWQVQREAVIISLSEFATECGLKSTGGLREQIKRAQLHADRLGNQWFVTRAEADRYKRASLGKHGRKPKADEGEE